MVGASTNFLVLHVPSLTRGSQCVDSRDYVVAHYSLKPPEKPAYNTSGNILTIYEPFTHLALGELLNTLPLRLG